jgi:hypothetical protein
MGGESDRRRVPTPFLDFDAWLAAPGVQSACAGQDDPHYECSFRLGTTKEQPGVNYWREPLHNVRSHSPCHKLKKLCKHSCKRTSPLRQAHNLLFPCEKPRQRRDDSRELRHNGHLMHPAYAALLDTLSCGRSWLSETESDRRCPGAGFSMKI